MHRRDRRHLHRLGLDYHQYTVVVAVADCVVVVILVTRIANTVLIGVELQWL